MKKTTTAPLERAPRWAMSLPHVRKFLKFVKAKGSVTTEQAVEWDERNGRRLFTWDDAVAGQLRRLDEARLLLNRFHAKFNGWRVRRLIHLHEDEEQGIDKAAYYPIEVITKHAGMREQVVGDITRRMATLAAELRMWKLSDTERDAVIARLREAMEGE